jgi:hypothetical protein
VHRFSLLSLPARFIVVTALFVLLLGYLWWRGYFRHRTALIYVGLFAAGLAGAALAAISWWTLVAWIAVLDVALGLALVFNDPDQSTDRP